MGETQVRSSAGIARSVGRLVTSGRLPPGTQLPPVRRLAVVLGVSPMTVSQAWRELVADGLLATRGRAGTVVLDGAPPQAASRRRSAAVAAASPAALVDLSSGVPDPALLPDLGPALSRVGSRAHTTSYQAGSVVPELEVLLRRRWPFAPDALTVVNGAGEALDRVVDLVVRRGSRVLVEDPTYPPLLDLLEQAGAEPVGLPLDRWGVRPEALDRALVTSPVAAFVQPRAHNPTGTSMTAARAEVLAKVLAAVPGGRAVLVVEDDHAGDISTSAPVSLGHWLPQATVRIESFSKSHGPDLRLAAVGGAGPVVRKLEERRSLGPGWSSRLLQHVLVDLLVDPAAIGSVRAARRTYARRRRALVRALEARKVSVTGADGINVWVQVADEDYALAVLGAGGVGVARGQPFAVDPGRAPHGRGHVRVTVGLVTGGVDALAGLVARAAAPPPPRTLR